MRTLRAVVRSGVWVGGWLGAVGSAQAQMGPPPTMFTGDRTYADAIGAAGKLLEAHRMSTGVPGMQVAVAVGGDIVWSAGFGYADVEGQARVGRETRFRIGSTSKAFTATLVALLAGEGLLELDAPVQTWVPGFPASEPPVTPRSLVGHTSGIRHYERPEESRTTRHYDSMLDAVDLFASDPLRFPPGSAMLYSSYGYNLLGAVIEASTGATYLEALRVRVTDPLGLTHTGGDGSAPGTQATPYVGSRSDRHPAPPEDLSFKWPSGGLVSTAEDLVRFGSALLGGSLLPRPQVEALWTSLRTSDGLETGYGFGWGLYTDASGRRVVSHAGNLESGRSHLLVYPDLDLTVAILANTGESIYFNEGEAFEVGDLFARALTGSGPSSTPLPAALYGRWSLEAESPFGDGGRVTGEVELSRPQGPFAGAVTLSIGGASRVLPIGLAEEIEGVVRLVTVGGSHLELRLEVEGDVFTGLLRPVWAAPPEGMVRGAPEEVRRRMADRGRGRPASGHRLR